ncbi:16075_t:CDS:2, partial [Funneliformis geosporum]
MVNFLKEADMIISIIELIPKSDENIVSLSQAVKTNSSIVKAEEILDIANANILDHCYEISPELLTEDFISKYGNYKHMRWFRAYRQIRDA